MEEIDGIEVDLSLLPAELQPLAPLIRRYAAGDDAQRSELVAAASSEELRALREAPADLWPAINAFLDAHIERPAAPEQDVALVLDSFAQAAMEADVELQARGER